MQTARAGEIADGNTQVPRSQERWSHPPPKKAQNACVGRGPTKSWTSIDGALVSIVLRATQKRGRLVEDGGAALVREIQKAYQKTMRDELVAGVEQSPAAK